MQIFKPILLLIIPLILPLAIPNNIQMYVQEVANNPETPLIPYFILRTMFRMTAAYFLTVAFGLSYGIIAGLYEKPRRIMIPLLDILQSIPVLGYLPAAILFFINLFPGELGVEIASILLIFTGQAWAVAFGVYGATRTIPEDLKSAARAFGVKGFGYLRKLILPFIFPSFITGSILAWGGGWYFLVACEFMTFGGKLYTLPGVGYYIANSVYVQQSIPSALFGLGVLVLLIFLINKLVWTPLLDYSEKFKVETMGRGEVHRAVSSPIPYLLEIFFEKIDELLELLSRSKLIQKIQLPHIRIEFHRPEVVIDPRRMAMRQLLLLSAIFIVVMYFIALFVAASLQKPLADLQRSIQTHPETYYVPYLAMRSMMRILVAYLIALAWTLAAGIVITQNKTLSNIFLPLFDIGQSIPAIALFPFIITVVFKLFGTGPAGLEIASILLLLTGTQWYLLFNIIGAIKSIPSDIIEAANSLGLTGWKFTRYILLPAIFPGIIVGSIQAWGGAWNASIVSEYINYGGHVPFQMSYSGVELTNATVAVGEKISTIQCSNGNCFGMIEVAGTGQHNATVELHTLSEKMTIPVTFNVSDVGERDVPGEPLSLPGITLLAPTNGSSYSLRPYSCEGLGAFINKATAEWGDPWLVTIAIATMSLTILLLNYTLWHYLFSKAERYKFEMT